MATQRHKRIAQINAGYLWHSDMLTPFIHGTTKVTALMGTKPMSVPADADRAGARTSSRSYAASASS